MSSTGLRLLSALRKARSRSILAETPEDYFADAEELAAFNFLRNYVQTFNAWPTPATILRETGVQTVLTSEPAAYYQDEARRQLLWKSLHDPFAEIRRAMESKDPDAAISVMAATVNSSRSRNVGAEGLITLADSMRMVSEDYTIAKNTVGLRGIPTGWDYLDSQTDGWQNSDLITVVARTSIGKTAKLLKMAHAAHAAGYSVLFLSMEMGVIQLARRFFGIESRINPRLIRAGQLSTFVEREMRRQIQEFGETDETPFYWLAGDFKKTIPALRSAIYSVQPDIVFADASYLLSPEKKDTRVNGRREMIADVMGDISGMTKEFDRPFVQSVQFNRTAVKGKRGEGDESEASNPVAHLDLHKISEADVIAHNSSIVLGLAEGLGAHKDDERYCAFLKGREGEAGWYRYHYKWQPVNFDYIDDFRSWTTHAGNAPIELGMD